MLICTKKALIWTVADKNDNERLMRRKIINIIFLANTDDDVELSFLTTPLVYYVDDEEDEDVK